MKKCLAMLVSVSMMLMCLTGCSNVLAKGAENYPIVPQLTEKDVIDYYSEALKYDAVITRNLNINKVDYEKVDISDSKKDKLMKLQSLTESLLSNMTYTYSEENKELLKENNFHYIKSYLNDKKLTNGNVASITGALGYYFIDVEYDVSPRTVGTFNQKTNLVGINGAFIKDPFGVDKVDSSFLSSAVFKLNKYYEENRIPSVAVFDNNTGEFRVLNGTVSNEYQAPIVEQPIVSDGTEQNGNEQSVNEELNTGNTGLENVDTNGENSIDGNENINNEQNVNTENNVNNSMVYQNIPVTNRSTQINISEFNSVVGSSYKQTAYMPELSEVFSIPNEEGTISGIGIYPSGGNGLAEFGLDRNVMSGKITLRYVYKDTIDGTGKTIITNVYPVSEEINTGFTSSDENVVIPEFLLGQFEQLIERADRAKIDNMLSALMTGNIYNDMGIAVLYGYEDNNVNVLKHMSKIRQIIAREQEKNEYLLEVETTRIEGAKDVDSYGTYKDIYYVTIKQYGDKFIITDELRTSRELTSEPEIYPDSATEKRLVALNLSGEVSDTNKDSIRELMDNLYLASSCKVLKGPKDVTYQGNKVSLISGMYDCFQDDVTMLSSEEKEYMNAEIRTALIKYGTSLVVSMNGTIVEWIGGYDNQAEFTTEELITYEGKECGEYMKVYYLVSSINNTWKIDERKVMESSTVEGEELNSILSRVQ